MSSGVSASPGSVTIVIPAFNEAACMGGLLASLKEALAANQCPQRILVVDDGSTDGTAAVAEGAGVQVIRHRVNRGYGAALKTGIRAADTDFVLTVDADGQHRCDDVVRFCQAASNDAPDLLSGHRVHLLHSPLWRMPGKWFLKWFAQFLSQRRILDLNCGLRLIRREIVLRYLHLCPQGFSCSTTIAMAFLSRGYAVEYIPIQVNRRIGKSTVSLRTGFDTILLVIRLASLFNPLRVFLPLAVLNIALGIGWTTRYIILREGVTVGSTLAILMGIVLFALGLICDQVSQLRLEKYE